MQISFSAFFTNIKSRSVLLCGDVSLQCLGYAAEWGSEPAQATCRYFICCSFLCCFQHSRKTRGDTSGCGSNFRANFPPHFTEGSRHLGRRRFKLGIPIPSWRLDSVTNRSDGLGPGGRIGVPSGD